jgi:hypothetical protein
MRSQLNHLMETKRIFTFKFRILQNILKPKKLVRTNITNPVGKKQLKDLCYIKTKILSLVGKSMSG